MKRWLWKLRMRARAVSMAPRRPAEWVDSSTSSDSGPPTTQPGHFSPVHPCLPAPDAHFDHVISAPCAQNIVVYWIFLPKHLLAWKTNGLLRDGNPDRRVKRDRVVCSRLVIHLLSPKVWFVKLTQNSWNAPLRFRFFTSDKIIIYKCIV